MEELRLNRIEISGRVLEIAEAGPSDGFPVFALHGTPGSRLFARVGQDHALKRGVRIIGVSRPGYGGSSPDSGRSVAGAAADVSSIAQELGIERFCVYGVSGGGPHTLACAALSPGRVVAAAALCSPAPLDIDHDAWMSGMGQDNVDEFKLAIEGRESLTPFIEETSKGMIDADPKQLVEAMSTLLCEPDVQALDVEFASHLINGMSEGLRRQRDGWIDDDLAFVRDWGFDLSNIRVPLLLLHGELDQMVPFHHARELSKRVPNAVHRFYPEEGHLSLTRNRLPEAIDWLLDQM